VISRSEGTGLVGPSLGRLVPARVQQLVVCLAGERTTIKR
jgi:hypothetical protein